ncbi:ABC transporter ATP-binding protein [Mycetocola spongiae]|uniref:ABC transporter ATP-binding protein n=1 Tax=Mycetocola spongiae TaxID=2859226 RepID=UPI001CF497B1|nr:ATP-binding cassette domain-containing protein [Mycetocola spongiae]UCR89455.1 ATP-binding cassette domain-containing protein [Mycetocola spongiae]
MTSAAVIQLDDLSILYPRRRHSPEYRAVSGVSLELNPGETLGIAGPSGSGKSTLLRVLAGRENESARSEGRARVGGGRGRVLGRELRGLRGRARRELHSGIGWFPQDAGAALRPEDTIFDALAEPLLARDRDYDRRELAARVAVVLDGVQLSLASLERFPYELSKGERQRAALARAMILGPRLLVADEPTVGIDATVRGVVTDMVLALRSTGAAAVIVTHDADLLTDVCDRVAVLERGSLVGLAPYRQLAAESRHPFIRGLCREI